MNEKALEKKLREEVRKLGGLALKFTSPGHAGVADRIVMMPGGKVWFTEMKSTGKELSPLQKVFKRQTDELGFRNYRIDTTEKLQDFLTELKNADHKL